MCHTFVAQNVLIFDATQTHTHQHNVKLNDTTRCTKHVYLDSNQALNEMFEKDDLRPHLNYCSIFLSTF